jgi:hypothetical protein
MKIILLLGASVLLSGLTIAPKPASAEIAVDCSYTKDKKTSFCVTNNDGDERLWRCDKQRNGTWKCVEGVVGSKLSSDIKPDLKKAVITAVKRKAKS